MEKSERPKRTPTPHQQLTFDSTLERIASGMEYYAVSVPQETSEALHARAAVPVRARVNGSEDFVGSLHPVGRGRHYLRVRNRICRSVGLEEGDRVRVTIVVRDRSAEIDIPPDLRTALRDEGAVAGFEALPVGRKGFMLRLIAGAVKPETRAKRIREAVAEAQQRAAKARR